MFIVDTDLNFPSDDFQALILLLSLAEEECVGVTASAGNTWAEEVAVNIRTILTILEKPSIEIGRGPEHSLFAARRGEALLAKQRKEREFVGAFEKAEQPCLSPELVEWLSRLETASDILVRHARSYPKQLSIICLGPLTNLYHALLKEPRLPDLVKHVVIMGGRFCSDPLVLESDFNFWFDEEAATQVLRSFSNATIITKNACESVRITAEFKEELKLPASPAGFLLADDFWGMESQHREAHSLWDQATAMVFLKPELVTITRNGVKMDPSCQRNSSVPVVGKVATELSEHEIRQSFSRVVIEARNKALPLRAFDEGEFFATPRYLHYAENILNLRQVVSLENTVSDGKIVQRQASVAETPEHLLSLYSELTHLLLGAKERGELWPPCQLADHEFQQGMEGTPRSLAARLAIEGEYFKRFEMTSLISVLRDEYEKPVGFACLSPRSDSFERYAREHYDHEVPENAVVTEFGYISPHARGIKGFDYMQRQLFRYAKDGLKYPSDTVVYGEILSSQVGSIKTNERLGYRPLGSYVIAEGFEKGRQLTMYHVSLGELIGRMEVEDGQ